MTALGSYSILFYSYTLEVLPYHMRTKGMAVCLFVDYGALFFNQYSESGTSCTLLKQAQSLDLR